MPTTPTPAIKKPRYTGPSGSAGPLGVNRRFSFKVKEEAKEGEEGEEEHGDKGEFILDEEEAQIDYQNEIPDTQDEEATFIRTWETTNLLAIAQLGNIYLKTHKLTPKQADGVNDLLATIDKVFDLDLYIQTIDYKGKASSDVRKAVARMKSGMIKEAWVEALEATRKATAENKDKLQKLAQQLQAGLDPDQVVKILKEMGELAREVKRERRRAGGA